MSNDSKDHFCFSVDELSDPGLTILNFAIIPVQTAGQGLKWTKCPAVGNLYQHIHPLESIRCLLRTVMRCYGLVLVDTISELLNIPAHTQLSEALRDNTTPG